MGVLFPNGAVYYFFTDDDTFLLLDALKEMLKMEDEQGRNYCDIANEEMEAAAAARAEIGSELEREVGRDVDVTRKGAQFTVMLGLAVTLSSTVILGAVCLLDDKRMRKTVELTYGVGAEL